MFFAHSIPYTYSMLNEYLEKSTKKRFLLCYSLAGNRVEYLNLQPQLKSKLGWVLSVIDGESCVLEHRKRFYE